MASTNQPHTTSIENNSSVTAKQSDPANSDRDDEVDTDAILAELEAESDPDLSSLRQQRVQELKSFSNESGTGAFSSRATASAKSDSAYTTLKSDDATLQFTTEHEKAIVHFFHPDFARCSIMDSHLERIAAKQATYGTQVAEVKLAKVDVSHAPFVVERMGIRVLPCVIGFVKGVVKGRVVGFDGICWDGKEKDLKVCQALEERFVDWGILSKAFVGKGVDKDEDEIESEEENENKNSRRGIRGRKQQVVDEDDDWD